MAEFAYYNSTTNVTGITLFYANYGFHPAATNPAAVLPLNPASFVYGHWMHTVHGEARKMLDKILERMRRYTNPQRKKPPVYQVLRCHGQRKKEEREEESHVILSTSGRSLLLIYPLPSPSCAVTLLLPAVCSSAPAGPPSSGKVLFR